MRLLETHYVLFFQSRIFAVIRCEVFLIERVVVIHHLYLLRRENKLMLSPIKEFVVADDEKPNEENHLDETGNSSGIERSILIDESQPL